MSDKYKYISEIRVLEKELLYETEERNKKDIKKKIKDLREYCRTEYSYCVGNEDWYTKVRDIYTGSEYLDEILRLYYEGFKYKKTYIPKDVQMLLTIYSAYIEYEIDSMIDYKGTIILEGKKDNFLFTKERVKKLSDYRKAALKVSKVGEEFKNDTESFEYLEKDILRFEAHGYFVRGDINKALKKYEELIKNVRFQDELWLSDLYYDVGEIYESIEDYKLAIRSYEKAGSVLESGNNGQKEEVNKKINEILNKVEK
ncbi:hypothetical protein ACFTQ7_03030 [Lysinibacillus sp. NPDC056959]|uniref:hypothetical protein n=1 Tax=Lysinibacillus sp. NPDC056959 TaxID=3345981 RepID=UPI00362C5A2A